MKIWLNFKINIIIPYYTLDTDKRNILVWNGAIDKIIIILTYQIKACNNQSWVDNNKK